MRRTIIKYIIRIFMLFCLLTQSLWLYAQGEVNLIAGETTTLYYSSASRLQSIGWKISKPSVVGIQTSSQYNVSAIIEGYRDGTASVTATYYYWDSSYLHLLKGEVTWNVTVSLPEPTSISILTDSVTIHRSKYLDIVQLPQLAKRAFSLVSFDPSIIEVDGEGKITGKGIGTTEIIVTTHNGITARKSITVHPVYVSSIELTDVEKMLCGRPQLLEASYTPEDATYQAVTWESSNESVAVVEDGMVSPLKCGEVTITATAIDDHHVMSSRKIIVEPVLAERIELGQQTAEVVKYESLTISATLYPEDVTYKDIVWTSSDVNIAVVRDGIIIAKKPGRTIITASTTDGTNLIATCEVTVLAIDYQATLSSEDVSVRLHTNAEEFSVPILIDFNFPATNLQYDIVLPEGLMLVSVEKGDILTDNHHVTLSETGINKYRILFSSDNNTEFASRTGTVNNLKLKVADGIYNEEMTIGIERAYISDIDIPSTLFKMVDIRVKCEVDIDRPVVTGYAIFDNDTGTLTFKYGMMPDGDNIYETDNTYDFEKGGIQFAPWVNNVIKRVIFDSSYADARPKSTAFWFAGVSHEIAEIVGLHYLNTSEVMSMRGMFMTCIYLDNLDLSGFNTSNVADMSELFSGCKSLQSLDIRKFDTKKVTVMSSMFSGCGSLTTLDLSNFNIENIKNLYQMFNNCYSLETIYTGVNWNIDSVEKSERMFGNCVNLVGGKGTKYDASFVDKTYARIDGGTDAPGYFSSKSNPVTITAKSYTIEYGDELPIFEYTSEGAAIEGSPYITCEATKTSPVGTYPIVINKGSVTNFNDTYVNGTLIIEKAPLTITAKDYTIKQGDEFPAFEVEYNGFKNNETPEVLTTLPTISTTATSDSAFGEYEISVSGAEAQNYDISYVAGKLVIEKPDIKSGDANGDGTVNVTDIVEIVNYILEKPSAKFIFEAADVNGDGQVNVTDIVNVVNIILSSNTHESSNRAAATTDLKVSGSDIKLRNAENYTAVQFDINLSTGQSISNICLIGNTNHQLI